MSNIKLPKTVEDAITRYKTALKEYEHAANGDCRSYSMIEVPKLEIADALLENLGLPTGPRTTNS